MRVRFRQTGGVAGLVKGCELDTEELAPDEADELHTLVEKSGIRASSETRHPGARDAQCYEIDVARDDARHRVLVDDLTVTPALASLIAFLVKRARPAA